MKNGLTSSAGKIMPKQQNSDMVIQLLKCCEEQLRKDLTSNAGALPTSKSVDEVMAVIKKLAKTPWSLVYNFTTCVKTGMRRYAASVLAYEEKPAYANF